MAIPFATAEVVTAAEMNELARAHWHKTTSKQVVNTVVETDLLNGEITIDAGAMSTNRVLRLSAWGDLSNNSGASQSTPRFKLKLGATTLIDSNVLAANWTTSASRYAWRVEAKVANLLAASQWASFVADWVGGIAANGSSLLTTGEGALLSLLVAGGTGMTRVQGGNATTVDTTAAQALALTVTLPAASASLDVTLKGAIVEVV